MRTVILILFLALSSIFSQAFASIYVGPSAGIDIFRTRAVSGTIVATLANNKTNEYPKWGADCGLPDPNAVCWSGSQTVSQGLWKGERYIGVKFYRKGASRATVYPQNRPSQSMDLSVGESTGRWYRIAVYAPNASISYSPCPTIRTAKLPNEAAATIVYLINTNDSLSTDGNPCQTEISFSAASGSHVDVSFVGMGFAYDASVYRRLPPGKHLFQSVFADALVFGFFDINNKRWKSFSTLSDSTIVEGYLSVGEYTDFSIISPLDQRVTISPRETGNVYMYVKSKMMTNSESVSTSISCQYTTADNRCALSDGQILLPLTVGIRAGFTAGASFTVQIRPGTPTPLVDQIGFQKHKETEYLYMFGINTDEVRAHPETYGKTFTGSISLILETNL